MPHTITVRPAVPEDFADIARISLDAYLSAGHFEDPQHPYMQRIQEVADRAAQAPIWVAERDGRVAGSVTLARAGDRFADIALDDELEFRMLVVDPALQRSGVGQRLLQAILDHARDLAGIAAVSLTTGENWAGAKALYEKAGFRHVGERDWIVPENGARLVVYRYDL